MSNPEPQPNPQPTPPPQPNPEPQPTDAQEMEFEVDEEAGSVGTKVGTAGWPEGAENEQPEEAKNPE